MDISFKFKIGDVVRHAGCEDATSQSSRSLFRYLPQMRWVIVELLFQKCAGGVQRWCLCRPVSESGSVGEFVKFMENELVASTPFAADRYDPPPKPQRD